VRITDTFVAEQLLRFNWLIFPGCAIAARAAGTGQENVYREPMPDIEITEECRALIAAEFPFDEPWRRLPNGNWQLPIDAETSQRLQKVRRHGETISDCIIRVIIVTRHASMEIGTILAETTEDGGG
jgi:hypothetical protein